MKSALKPADKKALKTFLDRQAAAAKMYAENDVASIRHEALKLSREGTDAAAVEAEALYRKAGTMDLEALSAATTELRLVDQESRVYGADLCERLAALLWPQFDAEALAAEERLQRFGSPIVAEGIREGFHYQDWVLHGDVFLRDLYYGLWALTNYFPAEFRSPQYYCGTPLGLFADLVSEG
jgi:hypothetical protein